MRFILKTTVILLIFISFYSCDDTENPIPNVFVDITIDLNDPLYNDLTMPGGYVYITGGYSGILIYHSAFSDDFEAYDRACPYDPDCGKLYVNGSGYTTIDSTCCKSEFSLLTGGVPTENSKTTYPMKQYRCIYNSEINILQVKN
ncbi:MAG: hypothetical protein GXO49_04705 [Chlorobi bacterium]|nr:hypothetical protein [Chlorobiota bacterium]